MDVSAAFPPELAGFGRSLRPFAPGAVPVRTVLAAPPRATTTADRAALSLWSQRYLLALVPPLLAAALLTDRAPGLSLDEAAVVPGPDGLPDAVCLPLLDRHGPADLPGGLLRDHLQPLAAALAAAGLPAPLLWSNAGYVISWTLRTVRAPGAAALLLLLQSPFWSGGTNPMPVGTRAVLRTGGRRVCCLRFHLPGLPRCAECPKLCRAPLAASCGGCCKPCPRVEHVGTQPSAEPFRCVSP